MGWCCRGNGPAAPVVVVAVVMAAAVVSGVEMASGARTWPPEKLGATVADGFPNCKADGGGN